MPLKINVGLSKKIGLPDYGSLGASCHVEYEAEASLLHSDLEAFHRQVKNAFVACKQAVQDELHRHQPDERTSHQPEVENGRPVNGNHIHGQRLNGRTNTNGYKRAVSGSPNSTERRGGRRATASQVRALEAISNRLQLDLERWLFEKFGLRIAADLSIADASAAIDELNATPTSNRADH